MIYYKKTLLDGSVQLHVHPSVKAPILTNGQYPKGIDSNVYNGFEEISFSDFAKIEAKQYSDTFFNRVSNLIKSGAKHDLAWKDCLNGIPDKQIDSGLSLIDYIKQENPVELFEDVKVEAKDYSKMNRFELLKMVREFSEKNPDKYTPDHVWNTYKQPELLAIVEKFKL